MRLLPILLTAGFFMAPQEVTLRWEPKEGDKATFVFNGTTSIGDLEGSDVELHGESTETVTHVDADKVVTKTTGELAAKIQGHDVDAHFKPDITTLSRDGRILSVEEEGDPAAFRFARQAELVFPKRAVHPDDTWSIIEPADKTLPELKIAYLFVGEEKIGAWDTFKITSKASETGKPAARFEASFWIDRSTGERIRTHTKSVDEEAAAQGGQTRVETDSVRKAEVTELPNS